MKHRREIAPPDTVVASPSVRTRQTIQLVLQEQAHWAESVKVEYQQDLFTDALDSYWNIIHHSLPDSSTRILLVGHNPALRELALQLTGSTDIMVKPATLLEFQWPFHLATWADIQPGTANLTLWLPPSIASQE
jgi:phosphohistidine phosphatase SixA